jgi:hypothetical protein
MLIEFIGEEKSAYKSNVKLLQMYRKAFPEMPE